jgi:hypothetical protein
MTANLDSQVRYAQLLAESTLIPRHLRGNPANVLLFLALAEAQQVMPAVAFTGCQVIGDTPTMKPEMMRAQILRHGHSLRYEQWDKTICKLTGTRADNGDTVTVTWTMQKAKDAGLKPDTGTWSKYPEAMLSARATGELARALFADCLNGISYTPEELGAEVDDEGAAVAAHAKAMEDQLHQPPPTSGKVEKVKAAADDEFTAPTVEDAPPPPPEGRVTDQKWFDGWLERVIACDTLPALKGLWSEAAEQHRIGNLTNADFEQATDAKNTQKGEIERKQKPGEWSDVTTAPIPGAESAA